MEPLGFCGIIKLSTQILHRNLKHFLCIAFILFLRDAFLLALTPSPIISLPYNYHAFHSKTVPSPDPHTPTFNPTQAKLNLPLLITLFVVSIFLSLLILPPVTFSVCRAVLNKSLDLKSSLLAVQRSALNLILTELCFAGVLFGLFMAVILLMSIVVAGFLVIGINPMIGVAIWSVVTMGGFLYLGIAWSLASTVAILEEKRGWEAMKRSAYLVDGRKWVVLSLAVVFGGCMMFLTSTATSYKASSVMWRWSCFVLSVGLQAMIALLSMASTVVLYLSCKHRVNEPLDTLIALTPEFGPPETSPKYMDLESARSQCHEMS